MIGLGKKYSYRILRVWAKESEFYSQVNSQMMNLKLQTEENGEWEYEGDPDSAGQGDAQWSPQAPLKEATEGTWTQCTNCSEIFLSQPKSAFLSQAWLQHPLSWHMQPYYHTVWFSMLPHLRWPLSMKIRTHSAESIQSPSGNSVSEKKLDEHNISKASSCVQQGPSYRQKAQATRVLPMVPAWALSHEERRKHQDQMMECVFMISHAWNELNMQKCLSVVRDTLHGTSYTHLVYHIQALYSINKDAGLSYFELEANYPSTVLFPIIQIMASCFLRPTSSSRTPMLFNNMHSKNINDCITHRAWSMCLAWIQGSHVITGLITNGFCPLC